jgi:hypothetical protein
MSPFIWLVYLSLCWLMFIYGIYPFYLKLEKILVFLYS